MDPYTKFRMKNDVTNIIKFYRDLYQHEYNTERIPNFFSKKVTHIYHPENFELLRDKEHLLPVDSGWGQEVLAELELSSSEKKLVAGAYFIKGRMNILGKAQKIFTPIYLHDITLDYHDELYTLQLNPDSRIINPVIIHYLNVMDKGSNKPYGDIVNLFFESDHPFDFEGISKLQDALGKTYPKLDASLLEKRFFSNERLVDLEKVYRSRKEAYENVVLPELAVGLVDKPAKSKGVINELRSLSEHQALGQASSTLRSVFSKEQPVARGRQKTKGKAPDIMVPVSLSKSQKKVFQSSFTAPFTLVIGPPGTGKSFTIAALAIQAAHDGKRVLIASKNEQACRVVSNKISQDIGIKGIHIDASSPHYRRSVSSKLRNIGNGIGVRQINSYEYRRLKSDLSKSRQGLDKLIAEISGRAKEEIKWGKKLSNPQKGFLISLQKQWIRYKYGWTEGIWTTKHKLHKTDKRLKNLRKRLIKMSYQNRLYNLLSKSRPELLMLEKAFQERKGNLIKSIFSSVDFDIVLQALPVWICKSSDIANILPLEEGLFDLLIIDEASQCDIASSIPLLYRAKSVVIVGDPNQLRHLSFISKQKEQMLRLKYGLSGVDVKYRDRSILDQVNQFISSQENVVFLDEHYRSMPDIISFSNEHFYSDELKIMTSNLGREHLEHLRIVNVGGQRNEKGENAEEAHQIVMSIRNIIDEEVAYSASGSSSIGIISPFRNQVTLIKKLIKANISLPEIKKHSMLIGTPFDFQGEERDVILLSLAIDNQVNHGTLRYLERTDIFNVTITRARYLQEVYASVDPKVLHEHSLLAKYLTKSKAAPVRHDQETAYDLFLNEVVNYLREIKVGTIHLDKTIANARLDIIVAREDKILGIDLVGFPGDYEEQLTVEDIKSLERTNIDVFILPYSDWFFDPGLCKNALQRFTTQ
jgi:hypothetical protein